MDQSQTPEVEQGAEQEPVEQTEQADAAAAPAAGDGKPKSTEEWFDILVAGDDGEEKPVKIPLAKLREPALLERLQPDLKRLRAEGDKRLSDVDRKSKEFAAKEVRLAELEKLESKVAEAKKNPRSIAALAKEWGIPEKDLKEWHAAETAAEMQRILDEEQRKVEEEQNPALKKAREAEEKLRLAEQKEKETAERETKWLDNQANQETNSYIVAGLESLPKDIPDAWRLDIAEEMTYILEDAIDNNWKHAPHQVARMAVDLVRQRYQPQRSPTGSSARPADTSSNGPSVSSRPVAAQHPAASQTSGSRNSPKKTNGEDIPAATKWGMELLRMPK